MDASGAALRDILLMIAGLAAIYLGVMVLRLLRLRRLKADNAVGVAATPSAADQSAGEDLVYEAPALAARAAAAPAHFDAALARSHQESELRQLREEVGQLREAVGQLRAELADLQAARHVSPQYSDAMALAQRGLTAQDVADRCDISLGEAELVWALSRGPTSFDDEEDYGEESASRHARSA